MDAIAAGRLSARIGVVISNNSRSEALARARRAGLPWLHLSSCTHPDPVVLDQELCAALQRHGCELVVLAGYMKKLGPATLQAYRRRIVNIHPALLPRHGGTGMYGLAVHAAVLAAGDRVTGASVHLVTEEYDAGPVLAQRQVPVLPGDTPATLAARVLAVEHELYVETLTRIVHGELTLPPLGGARP